MHTGLREVLMWKEGPWNAATGLLKTFIRPALMREGLTGGQLD